MRGTIVRDVFTTEWVTEPPGRLWIVRAVQNSAPAAKLYAREPLRRRRRRARRARGIRAERADHGVARHGRPERSRSRARWRRSPSPRPLSSTKPPNYSDTCDTANYNRKSGSDRLAQLPGPILSRRARLRAAPGLWRHRRERDLLQRRALGRDAVRLRRAEPALDVPGLRHAAVPGQRRPALGNYNSSNGGHVSLQGRATRPVRRTCPAGRRRAELRHRR